MSSVYSTVKNIFKGYSRVSTIAGLVHMFRSDLSLSKRLFWVAILFTTMVTGIYWSSTIYTNWKDNQVLFLIKTVGEQSLMSYNITVSRLEGPTN